MDNSSPSPEQRRASLTALMEKVDATMPSPSVRARKVWDSLGKEDLNLWDLACFCIETTGYLSAVIPEFEPAAKQLALQLYGHHYQASGMILDWSSKPENQLITINPDDLKPAT
jgi:hypothetical protein